MLETSKQIYRVDRRQINVIRFIFEAYEGVAVVSTVDAATGLISLAVAPGCEAVAESVMDDLRKSILIEPAESEVQLPSEEF
ncbi:MAG: DUF4911 domain-containing protein [Desulfobacteraceae bacterium]|jgi:hypothetical protein